LIKLINYQSNLLSSTTFFSVKACILATNA